MSEVTRLLDRAQRGDAQAAEELLPIVYEELRRLAAHRMASEPAGHTLQPTALVHEAWLRLGDGSSRFDGRAHFIAAAAEAMRRILIERARRKQRLKHGGGLERSDIDTLELVAPLPDEQLLALDEALERLAAVDGRVAQLVKLCFFAGLTQEQAAEELGVSLATVERWWAFARAWLFRELGNLEAGAPDIKK